MSRVLITGGAGFIGMHLARSLIAAGHQVILVDNFTRGQDDSMLQQVRTEKEVEFLNIDLRDRDAVLGLPGHIDHVYHLAALNGTRNFYERPVDVFLINLLSTVYLLEWFHKKNGQGRFLFSSSSETYAGTVAAHIAPIPTPELVPLMVEDPTNVRWSYGGSKIAAEVLIQAYVHQYHLPIIVVRYHNIFGPRMGEDHVIPEFIRRAQERKDPFDIFGGQETRAFCFVDDAVRGTILAMTNGASGSVYHVGNQQEISIQILAERICGLMGYAPQFRVLPAPVGSVPRRVPDITKSRRDLGYEPRVGLEEGLEHTIAWYTQHPKIVGRQE